METCTHDRQGREEEDDIVYSCSSFLAVLQMMIGKLMRYIHVGESERFEAALGRMSLAHYVP